MNCLLTPVRLLAFMTLLGACSAVNSAIEGWCAQLWNMSGKPSPPHHGNLSRTEQGEAENLYGSAPLALSFRWRQ